MDELKSSLIAFYRVVFSYNSSVCPFTVISIIVFFLVESLY